jgi:hypothetical protein
VGQTVEQDVANSPLQISTQLIEQIESYSQQIESIESEAGPFDRAILEPLQGLTGVLIDANDLEGAQAIIQRRLQLIRISEGPNSLNQLPVIEELITINIRLGNWDDVTDNFEIIRLFYAQSPDFSTEDLLLAMSDVREWHLTAIYLDGIKARVNHFQDARQVLRQQLQLAEETYSENDPSLIPWLYKDAIEQYDVVVFLTSKDELGVEARDHIARAESRGTEDYLREALNTVQRIRRIIESLNNPEAEAMAMIYEADFQWLIGLGTAKRLYRNAMNKLREAGIAEERVSEFFSRPIVLPVSEYYMTLEEALTDQNGNGYRITQDEDGEELVHMGNFLAWNESINIARQPPIPVRAASVSTELNTVDVRFTVYSNGETRTPRAQAAQPDEVRIRRDAQDAIEDMRFRPRFYNGRWRTLRGVTMTYRYPPKL